MWDLQTIREINRPKHKLYEHAFVAHVYAYDDYRVDWKFCSSHVGEYEAYLEDLDIAKEAELWETAISDCLYHF